MRWKIFLLLGQFIVSSHFVLSADSPQPANHYFQKAVQNARFANEAFRRCSNFVSGWLNHADPRTGLIPRNLSKSKDIWNARDAAADNYPFMVLTAAITNPVLFKGRMLDMLHTETRLTSRLNRLPDTYSFTKKGFEAEAIDTSQVIFGASEYIKDGLMPLTEWLGASPWSQRMLGMMDDIWKFAAYPTPYGKIPASSHEVNGELMQVLSRLYWMTGKTEYLDYAFRIADYYLFEKHPARQNERLRLRDHGCEIVSGLAEIYLTSAFADTQKKQTYHQPIHELFDCILAKGRNEHGMLFDWFNPVTGEHSERLCDTWGYNYNGFYTLYLIDSTAPYKDAIIRVLSNLDEHYQYLDWENNSADGYADAIESGLNLYNREPVQSVSHWIEFQTRIMWDKQQPDGVIEGWHGDGNFARTSIMVALWKTRGLTVTPWNEGIFFGAEQQGDSLFVSLSTNESWSGRLKFDIPRHRDYLHLPMDYPRINQFPEWFTTDAKQRYRIHSNDFAQLGEVVGSELIDGLRLRLEPGKQYRIVISKQ
ncbi:hypothetical protein JXJ21_10850 [candidate division KSB1 bacterium]|nr:hypothetical protein [candidate division KSB1 bacterium]